VRSLLLRVVGVATVQADARQLQSELRRRQAQQEAADRAAQQEATARRALAFEDEAARAAATTAALLAFLAEPVPPAAVATIPAAAPSAPPATATPAPAPPARSFGRPGSAVLRPGTPRRPVSAASTAASPPQAAPVGVSVLEGARTAWMPLAQQRAARLAAGRLAARRAEEVRQASREQSTLEALSTRLASARAHHIACVHSALDALAARRDATLKQQLLGAFQPAVIPPPHLNAPSTTANAMAKASVPAVEANPFAAASAGVAAGAARSPMTTPSSAAPAASAPCSGGETGAPAEAREWAQALERRLEAAVRMWASGRQAAVEKARRQLADVAAVRATAERTHWEGVRCERLAAIRKQLMEQRTSAAAASAATRGNARRTPGTSARVLGSFLCELFRAVGLARRCKSEYVASALAHVRRETGCTVPLAIGECGEGRRGM